MDWLQHLAEESKEKLLGAQRQKEAKASAKPEEAIRKKAEKPEEEQGIPVEERGMEMNEYGSRAYRI